jgi:hypothetical protein
MPCLQLKWCFDTLFELELQEAIPLLMCLSQKLHLLIVEEGGLQQLHAGCAGILCRPDRQQLIGANEDEPHQDAVARDLEFACGQRLYVFEAH